MAQSRSRANRPIMACACADLANITVLLFFPAMRSTKRKSYLLSRKLRFTEKDTGSPEVQIGLLSRQIDELASHLKTHAKDNHSRPGLLQIVADRRWHWKYLKKKDEKRTKRWSRNWDSNRNNCLVYRVAGVRYGQINAPLSRWYLFDNSKAREDFIFLPVFIFTFCIVFFIFAYSLTARQCGNLHFTLFFICPLSNINSSASAFYRRAKLYHSAKNLYQARVNFAAILNRAVADRQLIRAIAYVISTESGEEKTFLRQVGKNRHWKQRERPADILR